MEEYQIWVVYSASTTPKPLTVAFAAAESFASRFADVHTDINYFFVKVVTTTDI